MKEKVFYIHDIWDGIALKGVANFNSELVYFSCIFDDEVEGFTERYELTKLDKDIFKLETENWNYWLSWASSNKNLPNFDLKNPHPVNYAEIRKNIQLAKLIKRTFSKLKTY